MNERGCGNPALYDLIAMALSAFAGAIISFIVWLIAF